MVVGYHHFRKPPYDELVKYSGLFVQLQDDVDTQAADVDADDDAPAVEGEASDGALAPRHGWPVH